MAASPLTPIPSGVEMFQRGSVQQAFYKSRSFVPRPVSEATDMYETEFEEDFEEDGSNSPRISMESFGKKSDTTISSFDELPTPRSNEYSGFDFQLVSNVKPVEGPKGPHLFRVSQDSTQDYTFHLSMSPLTPRDPTPRPPTVFRHRHVPPPVPEDARTNHRPLSTLTDAVARLETDEVRNWSPREVAAWMYDAGFEATLVEKFQSNDISGAILVDLKFEDLKELDIQSFGKRHRLWNEIHNLRGSPASSPVERSRPSSHERSPRRRHGDCSPDDDEEEHDEEERPSPRRGHSHRQRQPSLEDHIISPAESVSIVGIEQLLPKPHKCSKGERCAKYRKQRRQLDLIAQEHPVSPGLGGAIVISGGLGHPVRPMSETVPSVVASSDVLGPGQLPAFRRLEEGSLRGVRQRDPQENVKRFLDFQHFQEPPTPMAQPLTSPPLLELFPPMPSPPAPRDAPMHESLQALPKLTIPFHQPQRAATAFSPSRAMSPPNAYRRGTPCSEMDVPVTAVPLGPVARDASQSVPPDMRYRRGSRSPMTASTGCGRSEGSRQPSFAMDKVDEDTIWEPEATSNNSSKSPAFNHAGYMKKRKTKFLRHEWQEHHFRLKGTRLAMHQDSKTIDELEHIDVDDYAVACSSLASNKLSAALKSMRISSSSKHTDADAAAFAFQLVPAAEKKGPSGGVGGVSARHHAATGKTHHFAVKSRDQRIDWMRELMLAKALKQKGEGYEMTVNGNMM
ncbi:MAG: hypothetical protein M4579_003776 [Chaenotheca gracillima]|nr:MAG: hypothetical protein M4579_003776 [Chaenotheca gracillima]